MRFLVILAAIAIGSIFATCTKKVGKSNAPGVSSGGNMPDAVVTWDPKQLRIPKKLVYAGTTGKISGGSSAEFKVDGSVLTSTVRSPDQPDGSRKSEIIKISERITQFKTEMSLPGAKSSTDTLRIEERDEKNRLIKETKYSGNTLLGSDSSLLKVFEYERDDAGRLVSRKVQSNPELGERKSMEDLLKNIPYSSEESYSYDAEGRLVAAKKDKHDQVAIDWEKLEVVWRKMELTEKIRTWRFNTAESLRHLALGTFTLDKGDSSNSFHVDDFQQQWVNGAILGACSSCDGVGSHSQDILEYQTSPAHIFDYTPINTDMIIDCQTDSRVVTCSFTRVTEDEKKLERKVEFIPVRFEITGIGSIEKWLVKKNTTLVGDGGETVVNYEYNRVGKLTRMNLDGSGLSTKMTTNNEIFYDDSGFGFVKLKRENGVEGFPSTTSTIEAQY